MSELGESFFQVPTFAAGAICVPGFRLGSGSSPPYESVCSTLRSRAAMIDVFGVDEETLA